MKNDKGSVGVIGASGLVGQRLLPLLVNAGYVVHAFSRQDIHTRQEYAKSKIVWHRLLDPIRTDERIITKWICLAPIWSLPDYFPMFLENGAEHVVAVSSTSRFTKEQSSDDAEKKIADKLAHSEETLIEWTQNNNLSWTILRPTLIYGLGRDKNISVIVRFIRRFSFFPLVGEGKGLRQPIHAQDVALACIAALNSAKAFNRAYNISGGEILSYRKMVERIFLKLEKNPRFVKLPIGIFKIAVFFLSFLPHFRNWSPAMAERMNQDLVFDHQEARNDFGFAPGKFEFSEDDLCVSSKFDESAF